MTRDYIESADVSHYHVIATIEIRKISRIDCCFRAGSLRLSKTGSCSRTNNQMGKSLNPRAERGPPISADERARVYQSGQLPVCRSPSVKNMREGLPVIRQIRAADSR